jgi:hypothetical protein
VHAGASRLSPRFPVRDSHTTPSRMYLDIDLKSGKRNLRTDVWDQRLLFRVRSSYTPPRCLIATIILLISSASAVLRKSMFIGMKAIL